MMKSYLMETYGYIFGISFAIQKRSIIRSFYSLNWSDCKKIAV